ncbi:hypothetical protein [Methanosarcina sp.]|uniref:hypothetical protein n=1 Tax=Methanosarcina sp. TaxID=2213 RepID=UPI003BB4D2E5
MEKVIETLVERIPKLKIASQNPVFRIVNRVSDHANSSETLIDVRIKLVLG